MPKSVTFYLGKGGAHLASRSLEVWRSVNGVFSDHLTTQAIAATTELASVTLDDDLLCRAILRDTGGGVQRAPAILDFPTSDAIASLVYSGQQHGSNMAQDLRILNVDEMSESSQSSTSTLSSRR